MNKARQWAAGLTARQLYLVSFISGAVLTLAFAPFDLWSLAPIAISAFYWMLAAAPSPRVATLRAYFFGYGFFMASTWWMAKSLLVDAAQFGWLVPFSVLGLTGIYSLWFALFGWLFHRTKGPHARNNLLWFALLWVLVEYLHSLGMFGFPWNLAGYIALNSLRVSQLAAITGVYGLSLLVVMLSLVPMLFLDLAIAPQQRQRSLIVVLVLFIGAYGYGMARMPAAPLMTETRVRVVQANIPQAIKWTNEGRIQSLQIHAKMSQITTAGPIPSVIIWPETAFPFTLYPDSPWPGKLAGVLPPGGTLITGVVRGDESSGALQLWNSVVAIDHTGTLRGQYDKHQLVPFGEFVPLRSILPIDKITPGGVDFSRGEGASSVKAGDVPSFSPLVCYEAIFPSYITPKTNRAAWLLNVTNDGWYGNSPGPYQHFAMSRMRAIEQGLPLVRAANTGISAVVDPYGRILRIMPLNERGLIDQLLPGALPPTAYVERGEHIMTLLLTLACGAALLAAIMRHRTRRVIIGK